MSTWIIILIIIIIVLYVRLKTSNDDTKTYSTINRPSVGYEMNNQYCDNEDYRELEQLRDNGYQLVRIKGTSFRNLKKSDVGKFEGKAVAEKNNIYDEFAIAIYNDKGKHVGYAPEGNWVLHDYITKNGGSVKVIGYIKYDNYYWGDAYIEFDVEKWAESLPIEERVYAKANLKGYNFNIYNKINLRKCRFEGVAKSEKGSKFPIAIYVGDEKLGYIQDYMYLYYTLDYKHNGIVNIWGYIYKQDSNWRAKVYIPVLCGERKIANAKLKFEEELAKMNIK